MRKELPISNYIIANATAPFSIIDLCLGYKITSVIYMKKYIPSI